MVFQALKHDVSLITLSFSHLYPLIHGESEFGPLINVGDQVKMNNSYFGRFSRCHMNFGEKDETRRCNNATSQYVAIWKPIVYLF
jgi:hypothetical protein